MPEDNKNQEDQKEISSSQADEQVQKNEQAKEKLSQPLPLNSVKPTASFKLHSFSGDHANVKIINWIKMYENLAKRSDWNEEQMTWNLPSYLEQEAFDYYVEHVLSKNLDWSQAKQSIIYRFDQFEIDPFMQFLSQRWRGQNELKDYFNKMRTLGISAGLKEEDILAGLTRGLPQNLRTEFSFVTSLQQWAAVAFMLQSRMDENSYKPWKNRRSNRNRMSNNKSRQNHQNLNHTGDHRLLQGVTSSNEHHTNA